MYHPQIQHKLEDINEVVTEYKKLDNRGKEAISNILKGMLIQKEITQNKNPTRDEPIKKA